MPDAQSDDPAAPTGIGGDPGPPPTAERPRQHHPEGLFPATPTRSLQQRARTTLATGDPVKPTHAHNASIANPRGSRHGTCPPKSNATPAARGYASSSRTAVRPDRASPQRTRRKAHRGSSPARQGPAGGPDAVYRRTHRKRCLPPPASSELQNSRHLAVAPIRLRSRNSTCAAANSPMGTATHPPGSSCRPRSRRRLQHPMLFQRTAQPPSARLAPAPEPTPPPPTAHAGASPAGALRGRRTPDGARGPPEPTSPPHPGRPRHHAKPQPPLQAPVHRPSPQIGRHREQNSATKFTNISPKRSPRNSKLSPMSARSWAMFCRTCPALAHNRHARRWPTPRSPRRPPRDRSSTELDRFPPKPTLGPDSAKLGRCWPDVGRHRPAFQESARSASRNACYVA